MTSLDRTLTPGPEALLKPLRKLMRPLVRLLLRSGVTCPVFTDLLRGLYVEVASSEMLTDAKAQTDSRISLLTGIHRKEVKHLRDQGTAPDTIPEVVTLSSALISRWLGTAEFTDQGGTPLPLPRQASPGVASFEALVQLVTTDVRARTVLDDWLSQNIVTIDAAGLVHLNMKAFVPRPGRDEQLYYFARNLHDHLAAAADNISASGQAPFLDRSMHYDRLSVAVAKKLETISREQAQQLLVDINRMALELVDADEAGMTSDEAPERTYRINLGLYLYVEDDRSQ